MHAPRSTVWAIGLIAASPAVFMPFGMTRFVFPKLVVLAVAIGVGAFAARRGVLPRSVLVLVVGGSVVLVVSALLGDAPTAQLLGRWPRYEGVVVLGLYVGCAWLGARLLHRDADAQRTLFVALSVVATVLFAYSALEAVGVRPMGEADQERTGGLLGNATDLGIVGSVCLAMLLRPALARSVVCAAGAASSLGVVVLSGSRAALLGTLVAIGVVALVAGGRRLRAAALGTGLATVASALAVPQMRDRLTSGQTVEGRALLWRESIDLVGDHWLSGVGPSGYFDRIAQYHGDQWVREVGVANPPDSPHAWWLQAAAVGGVPLLILAVALATVVVVLGVRVVRSAPETDLFVVGALAVTLGYGVEMSTHFTTPGTTPLVAFLVGGLVSRPVSGSAESLDKRVAVATVGGLAAVWSVAGVVAEVHLERGIEAVRTGQTEPAVASFESAIAWRPWDSDTRMLAAASLAEAASRGDTRAFGPVIRWARESVEAVPDNRTSLLAHGVALVAAGDVDAAIVLLDRVIELAPTEPQAYVQRGIARFSADDVVGALDDLDRALELDPDDRRAAEVADRMRAISASE